MGIRGGGGGRKGASERARVITWKKFRSGGERSLVVELESRCVACSDLEIGQPISQSRNPLSCSVAFRSSLRNGPTHTEISAGPIVPRRHASAKLRAIFKYLSPLEECPFDRNLPTFEPSRARDATVNSYRTSLGGRAREIRCAEAARLQNRRT